MADQQNPTDDPTPINTSLPPTNEEGPAVSRRTHRPVYEPSLLPTRKRRRASPWVVIPALLIILVIILYMLFVLPHRRRFVPSVGQIVFASDQGTPGHPHLWVSGSDGTGAHRLTTQTTADESTPSWSPDGSQITYLSSTPGTEPQIWVADADGQEPRQVTQGGSAKTQPSFAPSDNDTLGSLSGGGFSTTTVADGQSTRLLPTVSETSRTQSTDAAGGATQPVAISSFAWTPSKDRAAQGLAAVEDTSGLQALIIMPTLSDKPHDARDNGAPLAAADTLTLGWSPDGGLLAVAMFGVAGQPKGREASVLALFDGQGNPSGTHPLALFQGSTLGPQNPVFSPDGSQIVCEIWQGPDLARRRSVGLLSASVSGSTPPRPFYRGAAQNVRFSLDGQTLFFLQPRADSGHDLCRIAADGTGFTRLSDGHADITSVAVSPQTKAP